MRHEMMGGDTFPILRCELEPGEGLKAESGAMVAISPHLTLKAKMEGGLMKSIGRRFSGESFFMQTIDADKEPGWVMLATPAPGGIFALELDGTIRWTVQKGGFLAGTRDIDVSTKAQSLTKGMFSGEGFFILGVGGTGTVFLSSYGAIIPIDIAEGETVKIDNGHLVAWHADMKYKITKGATGWVSSFTSGEGLACTFQGPGRVYVQTRDPKGLGVWVSPFLHFPRN
ncbi:MAG: TIGR00266 family protein [Micavibrio sp.]|nr:MAG: TIGR00266 family protein [Micavibrio sp.]